MTAVIQSYTDKGLPIYFPTMLGLGKKFPLQSPQNQDTEQLKAQRQSNQSECGQNKDGAVDTK